MSRESLVFVVGFFVFLIPFLSIPRDFKEWFFIGAGAVLMIIGISLRRRAFFRSLEDESGGRVSDVFAESAKDTHSESVKKVDDESV